LSRHLGEKELAGKTVASAVSAFGASVKPKLAGIAIAGAPEDQLRGPLEALVRDLAEIGGMAGGSVHLVGETTLAHLKTRPDYAVTVGNALVGFIEVKAPGKGADPRKFTDPHDKDQWDKLKSLPNLIYTDGNGFSLWRDGKLEGTIVHLDGNVETSGTKLSAPTTLLPLISDFLQWKPISPKTAKKLAEVSARLCRLLRDEVVEQMALGNPGLTALAKDWRKLLFPQADDAQFADGYAQAVTFGLLVARARDISLAEGIDHAAQELRKTNSLVGTALRLLTDEPANQKALKTSLGTLTRVLEEVNWHFISKDKPEAWLYFYEDFLEVYDNTLRKRTGSYYTPPEVVFAMVNLVDEALRGSLFERPAGFAAADVVVADPAVGTGTFLLGVLRRIAETVSADQGAGAVRGAIEAAAKRVIGFEIQFGPFAVAQLRIIAEMQALLKTPKKPTPPIPELKLFITDTLSNPYVEEEWLPQVMEAVAKSRRDANTVKKGQPITVVIGNPPYKEKAEGRGGWIEAGSGGKLVARSIAGDRHRNGASARTASISRTSMFIFGAGRLGKCSVPGITRLPAFPTRMRKASSASLRWPASSTVRASRRCATICGAPVRKYGWSIVRRRAISLRSPRAFFKACSNLSVSCWPRGSSARARKNRHRFASMHCRSVDGRRNSRHLENSPSTARSGSTVRRAGVILSCLRRLVRGRPFRRSTSSSLMTVQA
jgi:hypothetical protein